MLIVVTAFKGKHISIIITILTVVYLHFITDLLNIFIANLPKVIVVLKYISDLHPTTGNLYRSKLDIGSSANYGITGLSELLMI